MEISKRERERGARRPCEPAERERERERERIPRVGRHGDLVLPPPAER
jgi:hypothetical protein